jgi:CutA1 divalent ion tolerance protein.
LGREIEEEKYYNLQAYTVGSLKQDIIDEVEKIHSDETPIIEFTEIEGNRKFLEWVKESVAR